MNRLQYWIHEFLDRWDDLDVGSKIRMLKRYPRKKLVAALLLIVFIIYVFFTGESKENSSTVKQCVNDRLLHWSQKFDDLDIGVEHSSVDFVGNGYVGVDSNGEMRFSTNNSRVLDLPTGFYPFVKISSDATRAESLLTDFKNGVIKRIQCFLVEGECACLLNTVYAHRTRKGALVQEIQITNPTRSSLNLNIERRKSLWQDDSSDSGLHHRKIMKNTAVSVISTAMCSNAPGQVEIASRREETYRLTCSVNYIESKTTSDATSVQQLLTKIALDGFYGITSVSGIVIDNEHSEAWNKIHSIGFRLSHSKAPQILNSDRINSSKYAVLSNIRAPQLEIDADELTKKNLANSSQQRERCYSGHSNLLFPSRLWEDLGRPDQLVKTADLWLLTLEKRGCSSLLKAGASGFAQAFVLSLTACSFHDGHLEMGMAASDLHREMAFSGIPIGSGGSTVSVEVKIGSDNRPYLEVASTDTLFACDGGCLDEPVTLGKTFTKLPIKVTKPATSILYVASSRRHLEQLRSTIHVAEVGAAPAHEEDVLSLHRTGSRFGGLPTSFWVFLGVLLIAFHAFLAKLLWSEWRKGDMTPYNPYLRNRYSYARSH